MEAVWPLKKEQDTPVARTRWRKGLIQSLITGIIGWIVFRYFDHRVFACVIWAFAVTILVSSMVYAPVFDAIERFGAALGIWAGTALTYLLLVPFYYLVFMPGHILLAIKGKDPLHRQFPCADSTCWAPRRTKLHDRHYRKQFS